MKIDIVINTDDNYIQHAMAMLCSLYEHNVNNKIVLHVLTHNLSDINCTCIKELSEKYGHSIVVYNVNEDPLDGVQFRNKRPLTKAAYYRLLLSSIIDNSIDKILYLDCDMIVLGDVSQLFLLDLNDFALAATADYMPSNDEHRQQLNLEFDERTFCSGIMLVNLKYWRDNNCEKELLTFAKKHREPVYLHDQDVLNHVFRKKWFRLPPKWNRIIFNIVPGGSIIGYRRKDINEYYHQPIIIHYANKVKPWYNMWMPMRGYYRKYLKKSGYQKITFKTISIKERISLNYTICRYLYKYYILPFIPQSLFIMVHDVFNLIGLFFQPAKIRDKYYYHKMGL